MRSGRIVHCTDIGLMDFSKAHEIQLDILDARISKRLDRDVLLVTEHPPVLTIGRRGNRDSLKVPPSFLSNAGIDLIHIERGGDVTFHGPGQLVLYPIFQIRHSDFTVAGLVEKLEEVMIRTCEEMGISATRNPLNHGVWVDDRKIGFIGIAVRRGVSFHGMALNVNPSMEPFEWIHPCGLNNVRVTSLTHESARPVSGYAAKTALLKHFENIFDISFRHSGIADLKGVSD